MQNIRWGFFAASVGISLMFLIVFFQNLSMLYYAMWTFLFFGDMNTVSGFIVLISFIGGAAASACFFIAIKGGRLDPNAHGKEHPDSWDRVADQY